MRTSEKTKHYYLNFQLPERKEDFGRVLDVVFWLNNEDFELTPSFFDKIMVE